MKRKRRSLGKSHLCLNGRIPPLHQRHLEHRINPHGMIVSAGRCFNLLLSITNAYYKELFVNYIEFLCFFFCIYFLDHFSIFSMFLLRYVHQITCLFNQYVMFPKMKNKGVLSHKVVTKKPSTLLTYQVKHVNFCSEEPPCIYNLPNLFLQKILLKHYLQFQVKMSIVKIHT